MATKTIIAIYLLSTGFIRADFSNMVRGAPSEGVHIPVMAVLIHHPTQGWGLFDTGFGNTIEEQRAAWPEKISRWFLPIEMTRGASVCSQITGEERDCSKIKWIVLSHLHMDHAGGLKDFPNATIFIDQREWEARGRTHWEAVRKGEILDQYEGLEGRIHFLDMERNPAMTPFPRSADIFGDQSLIALPTPGHTPGHISLLVQTEPTAHQGFLLTGDVAWTHQNIEGPIPKGWLVTHLEEWNAEQQQESLYKIHHFLGMNRQVEAIPAHDPHLWLYTKRYADPIYQQLPQP